MSELKQVIIIRKDLNMRRGKEIVQSNHWVAGFLNNRTNEDTDCNGSVVITLDEKDEEWLFGIQKKICLQVNSEQELISIHNDANKDGLESHLIQDLGLTEFKEPTYTCCVIGPDYSEKIDKITSHLKLY